jgi:hypothetical protein
VAAAFPSIVSSWATGAEFLRLVQKSDGPASFFHPLPDAAPAYDPGSLVSVLVQLTDRGAAFRVHARVVHTGDTKDGRGMRLEFLPEESERQELVLAAAEGESVAYVRRRHPRLPCDLPVTVRLSFWKRRRARAVDIGEGGLRLVSVPPLELDAEIEIAVELPSGKKLELRAQVISITNDGPSAGAGLAFVFTSSRERAAAAEAVALVRTLKP